MDPAGTHSHTMMPGTHTYMALKIELGPSCDYTEKVDIFAFGVLIVHTLTHQLPMPGPTRAKVKGKMIAVGEYERREDFSSSDVGYYGWPGHRPKIRALYSSRQT